MVIFKVYTGEGQFVGFASSVFMAGYMVAYLTNDSHPLIQIVRIR